MEVAGNIADELMSTKEQALAAAFASMAVVSTLPFNGFASLHIAGIQGYFASFKLISDRAWRVAIARLE